MGLNVQETALLTAGALLVARFFLRTAIPGVRRRFLRTADRRSADLREEFVPLAPGSVASGLVASATASAGIVLALTGSAAAALAGGTLPLLLSGMAVRAFRSRRRARILSRLPTLLDLLAGHMKAGHSLPESLAETVPLLPPGIREEMGWVLQQTRLGTPVADSLLAWEKRLRAEEVSLFVRPLRAALPGGANTVELLERTRDILRMRARMREKLRSMTAQARLQAVVLTLLPPGFAAALSLIDPGFLPTLFGTHLGKAIVAAVSVLLVTGWLVIRAILSARP
jgi:tight adherence protein B